MPRLLLLLLTLACVALLATPAHAAELLAVLELSGALPADQRHALTDAVRQAATDATAPAGIKVMTQENMETLLTDMGMDASYISEGACEVDTLRNLQANYGVTGEVTDFGGTYLVTLQLYEMRGGTMMGSEQVKGTDALALVTETVPDATRELLARLPGVGGGTAAPVVVTTPAAASTLAPITGGDAPFSTSLGAPPSPGAGNTTGSVFSASTVGVPPRGVAYSGTTDRFGSPYLADGSLANWSAQLAGGNVAGQLAGKGTDMLVDKAVDNLASRVPGGALVAGIAKKKAKAATTKAVTNTVTANLRSDHWFASTCELVAHLKSHASRPDFNQALQMVFQAYPVVSNDYNTCLSRNQ